MGKSPSSVLCLLLRQVRLEAGLTQAELAQRVNRPQSYVSKYEIGERRLDILELLVLLCAMGMDASAFVQRLQTALEISHEA